MNNIPQVRLLEMEMKKMGFVFYDAPEHPCSIFFRRKKGDNVQEISFTVIKGDYKINSSPDFIIYKELGILNEDGAFKTFNNMKELTEFLGK